MPRKKPSPPTALAVVKRQLAELREPEPAAEAEPIETPQRREEDGWHPIAWDGLLTAEQIYVHVEALRGSFRWSAHVWPNPVRTGTEPTEQKAKGAALAAAEALCKARKRDAFSKIRIPLPPDLPGLRAQFKRCR